MTPSARHSRANRTVALVDTKCAADFGSITTTERGDRRSRTPGAMGSMGRFQLKMAIEIVDFPIKNGDFPWQNVSSPEGTLDTKQTGFSRELVENLKRKPWFLPLCSCIPQRIPVHD